jgi:hypothetical protein
VEGLLRAVFGLAERPPGHAGGGLPI